MNFLREQIEEHYLESCNSVQPPIFRHYFASLFYNETALLINSDFFTNIDYEDFYLHFLQHDAEMSVVAVPYNVSIPYGILDLDGRNILDLLEKPKYNYYANTGIYLIKCNALEEIPDGEFFNATNLIEKLIS